MKVDLSKYDNSWYSTRSGLLKRTVWYWINYMFVNSGLLPFSSFKIFLLRIFGARIGEGVNIKPCVNIKYPWLLEVGDNTWIGENVWIDNLALVKVGSNVVLSQGAMLLTGNHNYKKTSFDLVLGEIILEEGVWIGAKSVVGPGVTCKSHSVLSVGSVASSDLEAYTIYRGNPAVKVKERVVEE